jgi:hypothetical protein
MSVPGNAILDVQRLPYYATFRRPMLFIWLHPPWAQCCSALEQATRYCAANSAPPACLQIGGPCRIEDVNSYMVCSGEQQNDVTEQVGWHIT